MEAVISAKAARLARQRGLVDRGPCGLEAHLALGAPIGRSGRDRLRFHMSVEAWDEFASWARQASLVPPGATTRVRADASSIRIAGRAVEGALDALARHPGYRGLGVVGDDPTVLPGWRCGDGRWWPTRRLALLNSDGSTLEVEGADLIPELVRRRGRNFTRWSPHRREHGVEGDLADLVHHDHDRG